MHKHGSGNGLEQERKQHTFSCHPSISHNFCKYEMLPIHCCIIISLMCGLNCGLQKLYMHKHGSGNCLEQERKQLTFSCHPSISHARAPSCVHLPCRFILQLLLQKFHFMNKSSSSSWLQTNLLTAVCFKANLYIAA